jgi:hypothetical protein
MLNMKSVLITLAMASAGLGAVTPAHDAGLARAAIPNQGNVYWHTCGYVCTCEISEAPRGRGR